MSKPVDCMEKCAVSGLRELEVLFPFLFFVFYNGKERQTPQCKLLALRGSFESVLSEVDCEEMLLITGHLCQLPATNRFQLPSPEKNGRCSVSRSSGANRRRREPDLGQNTAGCPQTGSRGKALVPYFVFCSPSGSGSRTRETAHLNISLDIFSSLYFFPLRSFELWMAHCCVLRCWWNSKHLPRNSPKREESQKLTSG